MPEQFGLKQGIIEKIQAAFEPFDDIDSVILYGSRAKGNYKNGSDIDLTINAHANVQDNGDLLFRVIDALDELDLVYSFDVSIFSQIQNDDLIDHINRVGIIFYQNRTKNL